MNIFNEKHESLINLYSLEIDLASNKVRISFRKTDIHGTEKNTLFKEEMTLSMLEEMKLIDLTGIANLLLNKDKQRYKDLFYYGNHFFEIIKNKVSRQEPSSFKINKS